MQQLMTSVIARIRIGRRGLFLLFLLLLDLTIGYSIVAPLAFGLSARQVYAPFVMLAPISVWSAAWIIVGTVCGVAAFWRRARATAFAAAALIKTGWGLVYLAGWLEGTEARGYLSTTIFLTFALVVLVVAGWPEVER